MLIKILILVVFGIKLQSQIQINIKLVAFSEFPKSIQFEGKFKEGYSYKDSLGNNIILLTETGRHKSKKVKHENEGIDAELFAYHFILKNDKYVQTWKIYDYIFDCPVDIEASFIKNTVQVTDLNQNGIAEIWVVYKTVCHGDVSPSDMKIIMYEGITKHWLKGQTRVFEGTDEKGVKHYAGGDFKFCLEFKKGDKRLLDFAKKFWKMYN